MKIAFIGNFAPKKGSRLFYEIVEMLGPKHDWYIFGNLGDIESYKKVQKYIRMVIPYEDGQLREVIRKYEIELGLLLSIWPETFSKTFFELIQLELPFIATKTGYPPTIFREYPMFIDLNSRTLSLDIKDVIDDLNDQKIKLIKKIISDFKIKNIDQHKEISEKKWDLLKI